MKATLIFKLDWEKGSGEKLADFKKKYEAMQAHITRLQVNGNLPRGDVRWVIGRANGPIPLPPPVVENLGAPELVHQSGQVLHMPLGRMFAPL